MDIKISTLQQVAAMNVGNILKRIHPEHDGGTDVFEVKSINTSNDMIGLVMTGDSVVGYGAPGDIGRLFIRSANLMQQDIWWICS
jgi:hypothetical protein